MVEITDDCHVRELRVHRGCILELFGDRYSIDLDPIPLHEGKVIVGMNWLIPMGSD